MHLFTPAVLVLALVTILLPGELEVRASSAAASSNNSASFSAVQAQRDLRSSLRIERDVVYKTTEKMKLKLDLYLPKAKPKAKHGRGVIVWIHGGAWLAGSKNRVHPWMLELTQHDYAVVSVQYRLSQQAIFPAQIHDCKAAIRWIRGNAEKYDLNPDCIVVAGASAGGHLVALLGTSGGVKALEGETVHMGESSRVQGVIDFFGPTDLLLMGKQSGPDSRIDHDAANSPESKLIGASIQDHPEKTRKANPMQYVSKDDAPFLIFHGDKDDVVPYQQSVILHEALEKVKVPTTLVRVKGAKHGFPITTAYRKQIKAFLDKHANPKKINPKESGSK